MSHHLRELVFHRFMRYLVLNDLFWDSSGDNMGVHYRAAMARRGWVPDWDDWRKRREARDGRVRGTRTRFTFPGVPLVSPCRSLAPASAPSAASVNTSSTAGNWPVITGRKLQVSPGE